VKREAIYICGPTAIGKSAVAMELARRLGGEIISVDSMQVYRGMDIGTAKPSRAERAEIPHHLIDVAELTENFDAAKFVRLAKEAEGRIDFPIYCGGTGLYFNALFHGLGAAPSSDAKVRRELAATPINELLVELEKKDPETFATIDRQNPRRVVRALEVIRVSGKPFSQLRSNWKKTTPSERIVGLEMDRDALRARIDARVARMFKEGLVEETQELLGRGLRQNFTASQALGYKQVIEHLDGACSLAAAQNQTQVRTRQFAKRQMTWFKRQLPCEWMEIGAEESAAKISERLIDKYKLV
jgi:tRNA dimethylallyltransferase